MNWRKAITRLVGTAMVLLVLMAKPAGAEVPNPTVTGPIVQNTPPGDASHDYIFFSTNEKLSNLGYVEQEFFLEGTANVYDTPPLTTATIVSSNHPYKSRIVVRRPAEAKRFNGTVIIEWLNVTGGFDLDNWLVGIAEHLMREGYAWVGVSAQRAGIHQPGSGLRAWSPVRYGTLDLTDGGTLLADELCYDIFSQAGQAVMNPVGVDPLAGLDPVRIIATGYSQSARRLGFYYNSIQPLANLVECFLLFGENPVVRTDLGVPVFKLHTETEADNIARGLGPVPPLQSDSDIVRTWQVAGTSHIGGVLFEKIYPMASRDGILLPPPGLCATPEASRVPFHHVMNAGCDLAVRWVRDGSPPPVAPLIETIGSSIVRDERGLALGGIRLAALAVPTALNTGVNSGPFFCFLLGTHIPFDEETLDELYPDHGTYVDAVQAVAEENRAAGYITHRDAQATILAAARSNIGANALVASQTAGATRLGQNWPNPFNPATEIRYSVSRPGHAYLAIYDARGQLVRRLVDRIQEAGEHRVEWNGTDDAGRPVASGVYIYKLVAGSFAETKRMTILK